MSRLDNGCRCRLCAPDESSGVRRIPLDEDDEPTIVIGPLPPGWWRIETREGMPS